jgi:membrane associated rhomboid family serine protease
MIDPVLSKILVTTLTYGVCGSLASTVVFFLNRKKEGPSIGQAAAVGFLIGAAFGAFFGIFQAMLVRP